MNVHVLGSDYSQEMMGGFYEDYIAPLLPIALPIIGTEVGKRLSPTQKSMVQQVTGTSTSVPNPPPSKKTFMEENGPYVMIGGALLVGLIVMMQMRRR